MTPLEFTQLLQTTITAPVPEARAAGKELRQALKFKNIKNIDQLATDYWAAVKTYQTITKPHNLGELVALLSVFGWGLRLKNGGISPHLAIAEDMALAGMTHADGTLRERARKGADYLRLAYFGPTHAKTDLAVFKTYIARVEDLIARHRPPHPAPYLDEMKPSVFKTLVLHWNDLGAGIIGEQFINEQRAQELNLPTYTYQDDDWLQEHEVSGEAEAEALWLHHPPADAKHLQAALDELTQAARRRLIHALGQRGWGADVAVQIEDQIHQGGSEGGMQAFFDLARSYVLERGDVSALSELSSVVRGIQSLLNHTVRANHLGQPVTDILVGAAVAKAELGQTAPNSWEPFVYLLRDAHIATGQILEEANRSQELPVESKNRLKSALSKPEYQKFMAEQVTARQEEAEYNELLAEVARYALDWYAMTEPWTMLKRSPQQLAAIAWYIAVKANPESAAVSLAIVASFGGWKSTSGLYSAGDRVHYTVQDAMADPELLKI